MINQQRLKALLESPSRSVRDEIEIARLEKEVGGTEFWCDDCQRKIKLFDVVEDRECDSLGIYVTNYRCPACDNEVLEV